MQYMAERRQYAGNTTTLRIDVPEVRAVRARLPRRARPHLNELRQKNQFHIAMSFAGQNGKKEGMPFFWRSAQVECSLAQNRE